MQSPEEAEAGQAFKDSYTGLAPVARLAGDEKVTIP